MVNGCVSIPTWTVVDAGGFDVKAKVVTTQAAITLKLYVYCVTVPENVNEFTVSVNG